MVGIANSYVTHINFGAWILCLPYDEALGSRVATEHRNLLLNTGRRRVSVATFRAKSATWHQIQLTYFLG